MMSGLFALVRHSGALCSQPHKHIPASYLNKEGERGS